VALPHALAFAWADQAPLDPGGGEEFRESTDFSLALWEVAAD
jgi:hypothetical protein